MTKAAATTQVERRVSAKKGKGNKDGTATAPNPAGDVAAVGHVTGRKNGKGRKKANA